LFTTWRWRHDDQLPNGHYWRIEGSTRFEQHSIATGWTGLDRLDVQAADALLICLVWDLALFVD